MSLGEVVAGVAIVGGVGLLAGARWADAMLADEARYLRAVRGVPASAAARRCTPWVLAALVRRRGVPRRWSVALGRGAARVAGGRAAGAAWIAAHRRLHRAPRSDWRVTASMLAVAALGQVVARSPRDGTPRTT